jgi:hypothetical protein
LAILSTVSAFMNALLNLLFAWTALDTTLSTGSTLPRSRPLSSWLFQVFTNTFVNQKTTLFCRIERLLSRYRKAILALAQTSGLILQQSLWPQSLGGCVQHLT